MAVRWQSELERRIENLEGRHRTMSCSGYIIEIDREAYGSQTEFDRAVEEAIAAHRETCDAATEHGFVVRPPPCRSFDEWVARHKPR
jgi:hypothetical protein